MKEVVTPEVEPEVEPEPEPDMNTNTNSKSSEQAEEVEERSAFDRESPKKPSASSTASNATQKTVAVVSLVASKTAIGVHNTTHVAVDAATKGFHKTKHVAVDAAHKTQHYVETTTWCSPCRYILHFPYNWPRTNAFFFGVLLPLWILIFISMAFGVLLTQYEAPGEVSSNNAILAAREQISFFDQSAERLKNATLKCVQDWESDANWTEFIDDIHSEADFNNSSIGDGLIGCAQGYIQQLELIGDYIGNNSLAFSSLSFNWNRCWDLETLGTRPIFHPTQEQIVATRPDNQEASFTDEWQMDQQLLFEQYLPPNATADDERDAFFTSVQYASGGDTCARNNGGTAWFFFTIMTTVGYGNQAPVTKDGRFLVGVAGLCSLILFAAVLGLAGYVLLTIFDDFVSRFSFAKWLVHPGVGVIMWGAIWLSYAISIAVEVETWWIARLPSYAETITGGDALWFGYITMATIGLGDYYLQPELLFASDTLKYSATFMIGFVFLSTFFGKLAALLSWLLPKAHNSLEARLRATRVCACWGVNRYADTNQDNDDTTMEQQQQQQQQHLLPEEDLALRDRIIQLKEWGPIEERDDDADDDDDDIAAAANNQRTKDDRVKVHRVQQSANLDLLQQEEIVLEALIAANIARREQVILARTSMEEAETTPEATSDLEPLSVTVAPNLETISEMPVADAETGEATITEAPLEKATTTEDVSPEEATLNPLASFVDWA